MSETTVQCECGAPMVERENSLNRSTFMGCSRFPDCRLTKAVPAALEMKRAGGIELPGLETDDLVLTPEERDLIETIRREQARRDAEGPTDDMDESEAEGDDDR